MLEPSSKKEEECRQLHFAIVRLPLGVLIIFHGGPHRVEGQALHGRQTACTVQMGCGASSDKVLVKSPVSVKKANVHLASAPVSLPVYTSLEVRGRYVHVRMYVHMSVYTYTNSIHI